jgi:hypothetical protein
MAGRAKKSPGCLRKRRRRFVNCTAAPSPNCEAVLCQNEAMKSKRQKLENLLAEYADALLAGKALNKEQFLSNYDGDREELAELLAIIEALDRVRPRPRKEFVERMKELIKQHRTH